MSPLFLNQSCDPFTPRQWKCEIGNYVEYSINITNAKDIAAGLKFAQDKNIRLVVKNTGHDYLGKSTGKGALALWTHNLKSLSFLDYKSADYSGPAIKMGAGIQAFEAYEFANARGLHIVGGECPTVGLAGGYTQGGGHSLLSSNYGLAADNALSWEVVTAQGEQLVASPTENADLYWALSGGGGGTYAVVLSLTAKAHPDGFVGSASLSFNTSTMEVDTFWELIDIWQAGLPALVDKGTMALYFVSNSTFGLSPLTALNYTEAEVLTLLDPFVSELNNRQIKYSLTVKSSPTYIQHFDTYYGPLPDGSLLAAEVIAGRLVPRSVVQKNGKALAKTLREIVADGIFGFGGLGLNVNHDVANNQHASNAVLPAWRDAIIDLAIISMWDYTKPLSYMLNLQKRITEEIQPAIIKAASESGTYMNEGDFQLKPWKKEFFGTNYARLREVKKKYDPFDMFYAVTAVGSDAWKVASDGRLCRS